MVKKIICFILILVTLLLSGCSNGNKKISSNEDWNKKKEAAADAYAKSKGITYHEYTPTIDTKIPSVSLKEVWENKKMISFDAVLPDKRCWFPHTISIDGDMVGTATPQDGKKGEVIIYNIYTCKYETIYYLSEGCQLADACINSNWVIWTECLDQTLLNWKTHAYNRISHKDEVIYTSIKDSNGNGYPGPRPIPSLLDDEVVWSPVIGPTSNNGRTMKVVKYSLKSKQTVDIISQGANPCITKNSILWLGKDAKNNKNNRSAIFSNKSGKIEQMTEDIAIEGFFVDDDDIAWIGHTPIDSQTWSVGILSNGKNNIILTTEESNALQDVSVSSRIVAWKSYSKAQVYDRKLNKLIVLLEQDDYSSLFTNNRYLYWTNPTITDSAKREEEGKKRGIYETTINIIDLNTI